MRSHAAESPYPAAIVRLQNLRVEVIDFLLCDQKDRAPAGRNRCRMCQGFFSSIRGRTILQGLNRGEVDLHNYMKRRHTLRRSKDPGGDDPGLPRQFLNCHRHVFFAVDLIECVDVSWARINHNQFCSSHFSSATCSLISDSLQCFELIPRFAYKRNLVVHFDDRPTTAAPRTRRVPRSCTKTTARKLSRCQPPARFTAGCASKLCCPALILPNTERLRTTELCLR